ncbi:hypothetical protein HQO42_10600 [Rhodococcus fascians]|nr:hypothetical protein [Rhodococcus fascians]MBY4237423.1 hypothetical protein [Rhodococcus fascians]MBY4253102.1 hypothetical protein [Rhodococcus fascians]MBY4268658.1 hypothetical protein [Rhodococcus fascians]
MRPARVLLLVRGLRDLRRAADATALARADSPEQLAEVALIPAARNLAVAISLLPKAQRDESTAAVLACRVLDAYEDLNPDRASAGRSVLSAARYLVGDQSIPPPPLHTHVERDSEMVDSVLAERIGDVRILLSRLPVTGHDRVRNMLIDIATAMAANIDAPMQRIAYGERVLGRVVDYACEVIVDDGESDCADVSEFAKCVGAAAQLANDLRDRELELYGAQTDAELMREIVFRLLTPALGTFALLSYLGPRTRSKGARAAVAYMAITTSSFFCGAVGVKSPYSRRLRLAGALVAAAGTGRWAEMVDRLRASVDRTVESLLDSSTGAVPDSDAAPLFAATDAPSRTTSMGPLVVESVLTLVGGLPTERLGGELPVQHVRRMMVADHLAFGSLERMHPGNSDAMHLLGTQFKTAAMSRRAPHSPLDSGRQR